MAQSRSKESRQSVAGRALRFLGGRAPEAATPWLPKDARYPALVAMDIAAAGLARQSGVYACWHMGARPRWIRVGAHADLALAITQLRQRQEITSLDLHGGVYVAWALTPREILAGACFFLAAQLKPFLQGLTIAGEVVPAATDIIFPFPPGTRVP